jgi:hypothetical protein
MMMIPACATKGYILAVSPRPTAQKDSSERTWMMNKKMGFEGSYLLGLDPSKMPAWGVARFEGEGEGDVEAATAAAVRPRMAAAEGMAVRGSRVASGTAVT